MKISSYVTARNPIELNYPVEAAIRSLFNFSDEIVVCDTSDKNDGTKELLDQLKKDFKGEFKVINAPEVDWNAPNHGIYDGITKAKARAACTGAVCFQLDLDEVVEDVPNIRQKIEAMAKRLDSTNPSITSLVVEYWGSSGKVRADINPWKERISLNHPNITHGIPASHRKIVNGLPYAHFGTDGCNLVYKDSGVTVSHLNFVTSEIETIRMQAAAGNTAAIMKYETWFNRIGDRLPTIYHFSWWSVHQKMLKYKLFWNNSWMSLYNEQRPAGYNPFFNKPFSEVSDDEMKNTALQIEEETSGHIFHTQYISGVSPKTNGIKFYKTMPNMVQDWANKNRT